MIEPIISHIPMSHHIEFSEFNAIPMGQSLVHNKEEGEADLPLRHHPTHLGQLIDIRV